MIKTATVVYLYVRILTASNGGEDSRTAYANMEACRQAISSARVVTASGGDSENVVVMWCGGGKQQKDYQDNRPVWAPINGAAKK